MFFCFYFFLVFSLLKNIFVLFGWMTGRSTGWMTDGRTDGKFHFIPKLHDHDVVGGWTGQMMNKKTSFHHDHARPRLTTMMPIFWTCWLLHHVANREAFHPFFFPSPLLHLRSMWQRVDIYSMESGDSSTNIRVCAIVSTSLKLANWYWPGTQLII